MCFVKHDFGLTARQGIALLATHATSGQFHNFRLPNKYMWSGNPYLTNMYFKYLAGVPMYRCSLWCLSHTITHSCLC